MNATRFLIVASLAANVLLVAVWLGRDSERNVVIEANRTVNEPVSPASQTATWQQFLSEADLAVVVARLRATEIPPWFIRALVTAEIDERFRTREEALNVEPDQLNWWQWRNRVEPLETRLARVRLHREKAALRRQLLGADPNFASNPDDPVPPDTREEVAIITQEFAAIIDSIREGNNGALLPSEQETIQMLESERRRELSELLSTEELAEYELRQSASFEELRQELRYFDANENEFRSLLELRQSFSEQFPSTTGATRTPEAVREEWRARRRMQSQADELLGDPTRSQEYRRAIDSEYTAMRELAARAGTARDTVERWFDLRDAFAEEAARIHSDADLMGEEKRAAISALAEDIRSNIDAVLGTDLGSAYRSISEHWMEQAADGEAVRFHSDGSISFPASW